MGHRVSGASCFERRAGIPSNPVAWLDRRRLPSPRSATSAAGCCASRGKRTGRARRWHSCTARPWQAVAQIVLLPPPTRALPPTGPARPARSLEARGSASRWRPGPRGRLCSEAWRKLEWPVLAQPLPAPHHWCRWLGAAYACVSALKVVATPMPATEALKTATVSRATGLYRLRANSSPG